ncbi:MAG: hypothetical protein K2P84_08105, partial [Undibacterium sp.]|nr:hypothetical protein [Undibacterium sp.]
EHRGIIIDLILRSMELTLEDENCDLLSELCISGLLIDPSFLLSSLAQKALALLADSQSDDGWLMSDYSFSQDFTALNRAERESIRYSLFHTTCVSVLLDTLMKSFSIQWPNKSFQRTGKMLRLLPSAEL